MVEIKTLTNPTVPLSYPNNREISVHPFGLRGSVVGRQQQVHVPVSRISVHAHRSRRPRTRPSSPHPCPLRHVRDGQDPLLSFDRDRIPCRQEGLVELDVT